MAVRRRDSSSEDVATELDARGGGQHEVDADATPGRAFLFVWRDGTLDLRVLEPGQRLTIGRGADADVVVEDARVSRLHARFTNREGAIVVEDLGSRNGTRIGDAWIKGERRAARGDVITIGPAEVVIAAAPALAAQAPDALATPAASGGPIAIEPAMIALFDMVRRLASVPSSVLLTGETGSGKEVVAERLHLEGARAGRPFVRINCASLPEALLESELFGHEKGAFTGATHRRIGHLETAAGGTVLLDEMGDLPLNMQPKLLRVLETKRLVRVGGRDEIPLDVRIIAATHRDLAAEVAAGRFREDLFYRLSGFTLRVPPLRERRSEILPLAKLFSSRFAAQIGVRAPFIGEGAAAALVAYAWPGNARELRNAMEHATVLAGESAIEAAHLPEKIVHAAAAPTSTRPAPSLVPSDPSAVGSGAMPARVADLERESILAALDRTGGNRLRAAEDLGISRRALHYKLAKYNLK